eukprot:15459905-Alexandrium_andersonii.AAC.1
MRATAQKAAKQLQKAAFLRVSAVFCAPHRPPPGPFWGAVAPSERSAEHCRNPQKIAFCSFLRCC